MDKLFSFATIGIKRHRIPIALIILLLVLTIAFANYPVVFLPDASPDPCLSAVVTDSRGENTNSANCQPRVAQSSPVGSAAFSRTATPVESRTSVPKPAVARDSLAAVSLVPETLPWSSPELQNVGRGLYQRDTQEPYVYDASMRDSYKRWNWAELEPRRGVYDWSSVEEFVEIAAAKDQRVWIGLPVASGWSKYGPYLPDYMIKDDWVVEFNGDWYPNYNNVDVRQRLEALLDSFQAEFGDDPRVHAVQMLAHGRFGEGYLPWDMPADSPARLTDDTGRWLIDAFHSRFINKHLTATVRDEFYFHYMLTKEPKWGWGIMAFGDPDQFEKVDDVMNSEAVVDGVAIGPAFRDRWKHAPVWTETIGDRGEDYDYDLQFEHMLVLGPKYHVSLTSNANFLYKYATPPYESGNKRNYASNWTEENIADFVRIGKMIGYRYAVTKVAFSDVRPGKTGTVTVTYRNDGTAPIYDPWTVELHFRDPDDFSLDLRLVSRVDLRQVLPGTYTFTDPITIPAELTPGEYEVHLWSPPIEGLETALEFSNAGRNSGGGYVLGTVQVP